MPSLPQFSATVLTTDTAAVRDVYVTLFDLDVVTDLGWFVSLRRGDSLWELCVWDSGHESVPAAAGSTAGALLAFVVDDVDALVAAARERADVEVLGPPVDEPWGQRHVFLRDPAGTVVDVVQITTPDPAWLAANGIDPAEVPSPA